MKVVSGNYSYLQSTFKLFATFALSKRGEGERCLEGNNESNQHEDNNVNDSTIAYRETLKP